MPNMTLGELLRHHRREGVYTQNQLANMIGCHGSVISRIENDRQLPAPDYLPRVFEILKLKDVDTREIMLLYEQAQSTTNTSLIPLARKALAKRDWGQMMYQDAFYGRVQELTHLKKWVIDDLCQIVLILGMGGVGKTALAFHLAKQIEDQFEYVIWRSLKNAPPLSAIIDDWLLFLSDQTESNLPKNLDAKLDLLGNQIQQFRCLLVLDNLESILQDEHTGHYLSGFEDYGTLIHFIESLDHQSCLLLTSREKPKEIFLLQGKNSPVKSVELGGLSEIFGQALLRDVGLLGTDETLNDLTKHYSGNPLALKLVSETIRDVYLGHVADFLQEGTPVFGDIRDVLTEQFERLPELEQHILFWLAIEREPATVSELSKNFVNPVSSRELLEAITSLRRRHLIERGEVGFSLQNVVMEYIISAQLIANVVREIMVRDIGRFKSYALLKAQSKQYVRETQARLILAPVIQRLQRNLRSNEAIAERLMEILSPLRGATAEEIGYTASNTLNILCHLDYELKGFNFSNLVISQGYLRDVELHNVNFSHSDLSNCVFTETFGTVLSVAFSPGGNFLAAGSSDGLIRLWRMFDGQRIGIYVGHNDWVRTVSFSSNGRFLASGSDDHTVRLWDVESALCLNTLEGHKRRVRSIAFNSENTLLASGSDDNTIRLWEVLTGKCIQILEGHTNLVRSVTFDNNGGLLVSASADKSIRIWDLTTGNCIRTLTGHTESVMSVAISKNSLTLASGSNDSTIRLWDLKRGKLLGILEGHTNGVWAVSFSSNDEILASGSGDHCIRLWDTQNHKCLRALLGHSNWVRTVSFDPKTNLLASGSEDQTIRLWDTEQGRCLRTTKGYTNPVRALAIDSKGDYLASGGDDHYVRLWNLRTQQCIKTLKGHSNRIWSVAFSKDGRVLASGSSDETIRLWDIKSGQCYKTLQGNLPSTWSIALSPDGLSLASGGDDELIRLWDIRTGQCYKKLSGHQDLIRAILYHPYENIIVSCSLDATIRLWNTDSGKCFNVLEGHNSRIWSIAISSDGSMLASGGNDGIVRLWKTQTGDSLKVLKGHSTSVWSVAFNREGTILASGCKDGSVRLWDIESGRCITVLEAHSAGVGSVIFSPKGGLLASGSDDELIKLWNTEEQACVYTLQSDRPYEGMNITGVIGLSESEKGALRSLGAVDFLDDFTVVDQTYPNTQVPSDKIPEIQARFDIVTREKYSRAIVAVVNDKDEPIGTGFLVLFQQRTFVVTCAHILQELQTFKGQAVKLQHFDPSIGVIHANIHWQNIPLNTKAAHWSADQDIVILDLQSNIPPDVSPLILYPNISVTGKNKCWCFGYVQSKTPRGTWIDGISCEGQVGKGFIQLSQSGSARIEPGASGSPVCDQQGNIIGMLQSIIGERIAYLTPTEKILSVLSSLP